MSIFPENLKIFLCFILCIFQNSQDSQTIRPQILLNQYSFQNQMYSSYLWNYFMKRIRGITVKSRVLSTPTSFW